MVANHRCRVYSDRAVEQDSQAHRPVRSATSVTPQIRTNSVPHAYVRSPSAREASTTSEGRGMPPSPKGKGKARVMDTIESEQDAQGPQILLSISSQPRPQSDAGVVDVRRPDVNPDASSPAITPIVAIWEETEEETVHRFLMQ